MLTKEEEARLDQRFGYPEDRENLSIYWAWFEVTYVTNHLLEPAPRKNNKGWKFWFIKDVLEVAKDVEPEHIEALIAQKLVYHKNGTIRPRSAEQIFKLDQQPPGQPKVCIVCGGELTGSRWKYCGDACSREWAGMKPKRKACECGKPIPKGRSKFCFSCNPAPNVCLECGNPCFGQKCGVCSRKEKK